MIQVFVNSNGVMQPISISDSTGASSCLPAPIWAVQSYIPDSAKCRYDVIQSGFSESFTDKMLTDFLDQLSWQASSANKVVVLPVGIFNFNRSIKITGPHGNLLGLAGKDSDATKVVLNFNDVHGVDLDGSLSILISNMTLRGTPEKILNDPIKDKAGVLARRGATIQLSNVIVDGFSRCGIQAFMSSTIFARNVISQNNMSDGFSAANNSTIYAVGALSQRNRGDGFIAEMSSSIDATRSRAIGNKVDTYGGARRGGDGYVAVLGGIINADGAESSENEDQDLIALTNGVVAAANAKTTNSTGKLKIQSGNGGQIVKPSTM